MRFGFSEEQREFQRSVRALLARECGPAVVRAAWTDRDAWRGPWRKLAELGLLGARAPESAGGMAMSELDLVLVFEETGRAALPGPVVETVAVGVPLLVESAPALAAAWLPGVLRGDAVIAYGDAGAVPYADVAAGLLVAFDGVDAIAIEAGAAELSPVRSVDGARRLFRVTWREGTKIAGAAKAFDRGALATAAQLIGLGRRMLEMTVEYVKVRKQFGVPIGSFQAVKHHLAEALLAIEFAAPLVYRAAHSVSTDVATRKRDVSMAKAAASDAAELAARAALQCHGAIGYTTEYDLHLYLKRTWALARSFGDAAFHRARVGSAIFAANTEETNGRGLHHRRDPDSRGQAERGPCEGSPG